MDILLYNLMAFFITPEPICNGSAMRTNAIEQINTLKETTLKMVQQKTSLID